MVENVALQVVEIWCWGPVTLSNFLSNLSRNDPRNEKQEVCACALVEPAVKWRDKLLEGWYSVQCITPPVAVLVAMYWRTIFSFFVVYLELCWSRKNFTRKQFFKPIHISFFRCSPRGFSATCLQQMQGSVVEGLSPTATSEQPDHTAKFDNCQLLQSVAKSRAEFYFVQRFDKKVARQVAEKIAQCNRALSEWDWVRANLEIAER